MFVKKPVSTIRNVNDLIVVRFQLHCLSLILHPLHSTQKIYHHNQAYQSIDVQRAKDCFGFEAKVSLEEGLKKTIDWYVHQDTRQ